MVIYWSFQTLQRSQLNKKPSWQQSTTTHYTIFKKINFGQLFLKTPLQSLRYMDFWLLLIFSKLGVLILQLHPEPNFKILFEVCGLRQGGLRSGSPTFLRRRAVSWAQSNTKVYIVWYKHTFSQLVFHCRMDNNTFTYAVNSRNSQGLRL